MALDINKWFKLLEKKDIKVNLLSKNNIERKIFRIYFNTSIQSKSPSLKELMRWTGKSEKVIRETVKSLTEKGFLVMNKENNLIANRIKVK